MRIKWPASLAGRIPVRASAWIVVHGEDEVTDALHTCWRKSSGVRRLRLIAEVVDLATGEILSRRVRYARLRKNRRHSGPRMRSAA